MMDAKILMLQGIRPARSWRLGCDIVVLPKSAILAIQKNRMRPAPNGGMAGARGAY